MHGGKVDLLSCSGVYQLRQRGSRGRRREELRGRRKRRRGRKQQTARSLCGRAAWPLALSPLPPLLLLLLLLSDDDRTEKNREKLGRVGLWRTEPQIGKTTKLSYSSRNAVSLQKFFFLVSVTGLLNSGSEIFLFLSKGVLLISGR